MCEQPFPFVLSSLLGNPRLLASALPGRGEGGGGERINAQACQSPLTPPEHMWLSSAPARTLRAHRALRGPSIGV